MRMGNFAYTFRGAVRTYDRPRACCSLSQCYTRGRGSSFCRTRTYQFSVGTLLMWSKRSRMSNSALDACVSSISSASTGVFAPRPMPAWGENRNRRVDDGAACATVGHVFRPVNRAGAVTWGTPKNINLISGSWIVTQITDLESC